METSLRDPMDLTDRVAVVVGAGSDIGCATAAALARSGARLMLADIDGDRLATTVGTLRQESAQLVSRTVDVTRLSEVEALVEAALSSFGRLDVMANLAGLIHDCPVLETREAHLDRLLAVNLKGVYFGCQAAARAMVERGGGSIVNMASLGAFAPLPQLSCYSISKAGVVALTRTLAGEVGPRGVRVNAVAPGFIEGGMTLRHVRGEDGSVSPEDRERVLAKARKRAPLRMTGTPEDVAQAVRFLASDASRYMTGQVLHPNGGGYMP